MFFYIYIVFIIILGNIIIWYNIKEYKRNMKSLEEFLKDDLEE